MMWYLYFPGGKGDCPNYRRPDHEKGHATSFYQVRTRGALECLTVIH